MVIATDKEWDLVMKFERRKRKLVGFPVDQDGWF